jgi:hypothetical protein
MAPSRNATLGQKAAAAIAAVQAKEAAVLQQLEDDGGGGGAPAANTLKCPRCHRVRQCPCDLSACHTLLHGCDD